MKQIIIGFSQPKCFFPWFSWLIRAIEGTSFSHTYVKTYSLTADCWLIYQAGGSQVNFMSEKQFDNTARIIKEFTFEISEESHRNYIRWAVRNAGLPYGLKTVLGILLVRVFNLKKNPLGDGEKTLFCAELSRIALTDFIGVHLPREEFETAGLAKLYGLCQRIIALNGRTK